MCDAHRNLRRVIAIIEGDVPSADELSRLYGSVGWNLYAESIDDLVIAVDRTTFVAAARDDGRLVGLARGVSDDYSIAYLQDILVMPSHQRRGIGKRLMEAFLARFEHVRSKVLLTDDEERQHDFYASAGFEDIATRPGPRLHAFVMFRPPE
jgi:GNAT superfamily N-acetyltransferase